MLRNPELLDRRLNSLEVTFKKLEFLLNRHDSSKEQFQTEIDKGKEQVSEITSQIERELGITRNG